MSSLYLFSPSSPSNRKCCSYTHLSQIDIPSVVELRPAAFWSQNSLRAEPVLLFYLPSNSDVILLFIGHFSFLTSFLLCKMLEKLRSVSFFSRLWEWSQWWRNVTHENKVKVKLFLCFNWAPRHEGVLGEWKCSSLISALGGGEWSASRSGRFTPEERVLRTHWIVG